MSSVDDTPAPSQDGPQSPRSASTPVTPANQLLAPPSSIPPGVFVAPPPPRPNLSSMLFLTAFFFFMSGNNNVPQQIVTDEEGRIVPRITELDVARQGLEEYRGWLNGTEGNWTEAAAPVLQPEKIIPSQYDHDPIQGPFFTNITGFYRNAQASSISLVSSQHPASTTFFGQTHIPNLNTSSWNGTLAEELRGSWNWATTTKVDFNLKERSILDIKGHENTTFDGWTWVKGGITLYDEGQPALFALDGEDFEVEEGSKQDIEYEVYGLHHVRNGTYRLFGMPEGMRVDIRRIPTLFDNKEEHDLAAEVILLELEKELIHQQENLLLMDAKTDINSKTACPILVYMTVPPLPQGSSPQELERYEEELLRPSGIRLSLPKPPNYWDGIGLGGVIIADQCGVAIGFDKGHGVRIDDFWRKSVNYASFATLLQLALLLLLVRQMETTRTPSVLSKVSVWTVVIMGVSDSWIFSAHVVMGLLSDNRTSIALLVPGFLGLCSAVVFGPRYAVLLHRIQAPERVSSPPPAPAQVVRPVPVTNTEGVTDGQATPPTTTPAPANTPASPGAEPSPTFREFFFGHPAIRLVGAILLFFIFLQVAFLPSVIPFFLFGLFGFWVPQIYRNAVRGTNGAFDHTFIIGTSIARLSLPLYVFGCPDNIFFVATNRWVWVLPVWQAAQILVLLAQERLGPAFFLPKRLQPADTYNYHPLLPSSSPDAKADPEAQAALSIEEKTCSICMEEVDTSPGPSSEVLLGMNRRRSYAVAPCHHLFHTKCLAQWLAIKTICPLCKRSLPPL